jgi:hypothetical protein
MHRYSLFVIRCCVVRCSLFVVALRCVDAVCGKACLLLETTTRDARYRVASSFFFPSLPPSFPPSLLPFFDHEHRHNATAAAAAAPTANCQLPTCQLTNCQPPTSPCTCTCIRSRSPDTLTRTGSLKHTHTHTHTHTLSTCLPFLLSLFLRCSVS